VARIELAAEVLDDLDRFVVHMASFGVDDIGQRIEDLIAAIGVLAHSPNAGRRAKGGKRELVIGTGSRGFVALYRYVEPVDTVFILAVRGQREAGYKRRKR
jgi:plasmid stabilization system protein ParE